MLRVFTIMETIHFTSVIEFHSKWVLSYNCLCWGSYMKRSQEEVKSILRQGAFGKESDSSSWILRVLRSSVGQPVITRSGLFTWEDLESFLHSVNRIVVKQRVGKRGKVVIKQCWDSELLTCICFSPLQQLVERSKLSKRKRHTHHCTPSLSLKLLATLKQGETIL